MIKEYLITITVENPYPKTFDYRIKGGKMEVVLPRAVRQFRRENWKGRPLKKIAVSGVQL